MQLPPSLRFTHAGRGARGADFFERVQAAVPAPVAHDLQVVEQHVRQGRFQRSLALISGVSSVLSGAEVAYEHYRAGYGQRVMYTPIVMSTALALAGVAGALSPRAARTWLRWTSVVTLVDGLVGFGFHVRGVQRKPGGWRLPVTNVTMGPPVFAPLLFGVSAYLGLLASYLQPEGSARQPERGLLPLLRGPAQESRPAALPQAQPRWTLELREGRFQKHLAGATAVATLCSGTEALYSHYRNNFRHAAQWTPIAIAPVLIGAALATLASPKAARTVLPAASVLAIADGAAGFAYHVRGVHRRPEGFHKPLFNVIYGPPVFAPLLFAACGLIGLLASLMRRER